MDGNTTCIMQACLVWPQEVLSKDDDAVQALRGPASDSADDTESQPPLLHSTSPPAPSAMPAAGATAQPASPAAEAALPTVQSPLALPSQGQLPAPLGTGQPVQPSGGRQLATTGDSTTSHAQAQGMCPTLGGSSGYRAAAVNAGAAGQLFPVLGPPTAPLSIPSERSRAAGGSCPESAAAGVGESEKVRRGEAAALEADSGRGDANEASGGRPMSLDELQGGAQGLLG